uniref:Mitochondrial ribosomal protein L1 n=1 Tax=Nothoprocta perdicaria TaxID=30464 RepID=A0A8C6ZFW8_NOTPE
AHSWVTTLVRVRLCHPTHIVVLPHTVVSICTQEYGCVTQPNTPVRGCVPPPWAAQEETKKRRRPRLPLLSKPVDDVYLTWRYKRPSYDVDVAVGMLKKFQQLDFTYPKQFVYINVTLDMSLPKKKKKVEQFSSLVRLPHRFTDETNKVLVFTEVSKGELLSLCTQHSHAMQPVLIFILEDEIKMDFYVAVPEIMPKLIPLKSKLRRKYPSARRNSMGQDIPKMLQFFKEGLEYAVQDEHLIKTRIARLDMPTEQIVDNLKAIIQDIYTYKPPSIGKVLLTRMLSGDPMVLSIFRW